MRSLAALKKERKNGREDGLKGGREREMEDRTERKE